MIESGVFFAGFSMFFISIFLYPKSDNNKKLNGIVWLVSSYIIVQLLVAIISAVFNVLGIEVNILNLGLLLLVLGASWLFFLNKTNKYQSYLFEINDISILLLSATAVTIFFYSRFTSNFLLNFETSDPSIHFQMARDVLVSGKVDSMFFNSLFNALFISLFSPLVSTFDEYKIFIISDMFAFWISFMMFWSSIRLLLRNNRMIIIGIIVSILYILGYPLTNHLFGFGYLGWGVTIISFIIFIVKHLEYRLINLKFALVLIVVSCFGILITYVLFAPITFLSVLIYLVMYLTKMYKFNFKRILLFLSVLLLVGLFGSYFIFIGIFDGDIALIFSSLSIEGYINRDLFSEFVLYIPLIVFAFLGIKKFEQINFEMLFVASQFIFLVFMLYFGLKGYISTYYYYKNYYVMWLLVFVVSVGSLAEIDSKIPRMLYSYIFVLILLPTLTIYKFDEKINNVNFLFSPQIASRTFSNIYFFNILVSSDDPYYSSEQLDFFKSVSDFKESKEVIVPIISDWLTSYWYYGLTNQTEYKDYVWVMGVEEFINMQKLNDRKYVAVTYDSIEYQENITFFEQQTKVYNDDIGFIFELK